MFDFINPKGIECMIMQSDESADRVIELFEQAYMRGYESPAEIEAEIYHMAGVDPDEFNALDRQKIQNAVYRIWGCE